MGIGDEKDAAEIVKFVRKAKYKINISVRSGGHSYSCTSSKPDGIQLDLRGIRKIELMETSRSSSGWAVKLGSGLSWNQVLDKLSPDKWTIVHGQCLSVGVGGFTLGGGANMIGTSARYGTAMEQVIEYRMVTASGEIITASDDDGVKIVSDDGNTTFLPEDDPRKGTNIMFGLRGAEHRLVLLLSFCSKSTQSQRPTPQLSLFSLTMTKT